MNFLQWKKILYTLARRDKVMFMVPGNNTLFVLWEQKLTPEQVLTQHCTPEAQRKRHGMN